MRTLAAAVLSLLAFAVLPPVSGGAADALEGISQVAPATIVYVSCDPATLARDAMRLVTAGYRATDAWPIDLMPQTAHVEVVMRLARARTARCRRAGFRRSAQC